MQIEATIDRHPGTAIVPAGALPISLPEQDSEVLSHIAIPDFQFDLPTSFKDFTPDIEPGKIIARGTIDTGVTATLILTGSVLEGGINFQPGQFSFHLEVVEQRARAHFIASTLMAMLGLAGEMDLQIPELEVSQKLFFNMPLSEISLMLQSRQWAYRLMVIERATGKEFHLTPSISEAELSKITFVYRAIVDRSFVWPLETISIPVPATQEKLALLPSDGRPRRYQSSPEKLDEVILGQSLSLGYSTTLIEDMIFQNPDEVRRELAADDGHLVEIMIRSLSGQVKYEFPEAPRLPDEPWDERIQQFINLEAQLDASIVERYHALAAATLAGLTEEEKKEVTARPELDEGAFLI